MKILLALLFSLLFSENLAGDKPIYFLTKERTGTSWSLYITQALTQKRLYSFDGMHEIVQEDPLEVDYSLKPICRSHSPKRMPENLSQKSGILIVTLRDYHEALFWGPTNQKYQQFTPALRQQLDRYLSILRYYDNFPPSRRKLITYENLITDPISEISSLFAFFQNHHLIKDESLLSEFLEDYEIHRDYMLNKYHRDWTSYTKGEHIHFHKKKCSARLAKRIRTYIETNHSDIWEKYLKHYVK